jgi:hypothetical protein
LRRHPGRVGKQSFKLLRFFPEIQKFLVAQRFDLILDREGVGCVEHLPHMFENSLRVFARFTNGVAGDCLVGNEQGFGNIFSLSIKMKPSGKLEDASPKKRDMKPCGRRKNAL